MPDAVYAEWWNNTWKRSYTYDTLGRVKTVKSQATSGWLTDTYTYLAISGKRSSSLVSSLATPAGTFSYTYDARGNIASVSDGTYLTTYTYDSLNQLVREDNEKLGKTYTYSYLNGNITSRKEYAYTTGDVGTATAIKTDTYEYSAYAWGDLLVKALGKSLTYTDGEITKLNGKNLTWGFLGKLTSCGDTSFTYDTTGRRLSKTTGSTTTDYYYAGDMLVGQKTGSDKIEFMFDSGGDYYGFEYNDTPYYYIKNLQGDVVAIFNDSGTQVATYTYDAWGRILATTDTSGINISTINPIRYRGYYYDTETGYYYLNARYYYPEICRFISPDGAISDVGGDILGYNQFAYCFNNPVNMSDDSGNWAKWIKNTVKWVAKNIVKPVVKTVQKTLSKVDLTYSTGVNVSGTPSLWIFNGQIGVSMDTKGNFAIQASGGGGVTGGTPSISISDYRSMTNAPSINELNGPGYQIGGSAIIPVERVPIAVGGDFNIIPDMERNKTYYGGTLTGGLAVGKPGREFHGEWGTTVTLPYSQINVYDVARFVYIKIMEW